MPNLVQMSLMKFTKCCKMPGLQFLPFLSYYGKTNGGIKLPHPPSPPRLGLILLFQLNQYMTQFFIAVKPMIYFKVNLVVATSK